MAEVDAVAGQQPVLEQRFTAVHFQHEALLFDLVLNVQYSAPPASALPERSHDAINRPPPAARIATSDWQGGHHWRYHADAGCTGVTGSMRTVPT
jgi:hypothetical protein